MTMTYPILPGPFPGNSKIVKERQSTSSSATFEQDHYWQHAKSLHHGPRIYAEYILHCHKTTILGEVTCYFRLIHVQLRTYNKRADDITILA